MNRPLSTSAFGCFQRVNFGLGFVGFNGQMGRQITIAVFPLNGRFRTGGAVPTGRKFGAALAAIALLDDLVTNSTIIGASFSGHKGALHAFFNCCANHWNHPLPALNNKKSGSRFRPVGLSVRREDRVFNVSITTDQIEAICVPI